MRSVACFQARPMMASVTDTKALCRLAGADPIIAVHYAG
ncbi:hypothetical protein SY94_5126 (plasmid) [Agrobacterium tumefaciens]|nr:hypothetical protein SY94_5126 [Agrobacterium tumefaciens]